MIKVTTQMITALKSLEARLSRTEVVGNGSSSVVVYANEYAALMAAIVALENN